MLLAELGQNSGETSQEIKEYIQNKKISILNAAEQVALIFVDQETIDGAKFEITEQFAKHMGENMGKINTHFLNGQSA